MDDIAVTQQAYKAGLVVRPVSPMYGGSPARVGLMLGFGGFSAEQLRTGVARLKKVLDGSAEASRVRTNVR
jgi:GntR family transcriptional regulator / MocR family aminotransferase